MELPNKEWSREPMVMIRRDKETGESYTTVEGIRARDKEHFDELIEEWKLDNA